MKRPDRHSCLLGMAVLCLAACTPQGPDDLPRDLPTCPAPLSPPPVDLPSPPRPLADPDIVRARLDVPDPGHVELLDVVLQATALARSLEPGVELATVTAWELRGGTLDLRTDRGVVAVITFEPTGRDPRPTPRRVTPPRPVRVTLSGATLEARSDDLRDPLFKMLGPLILRACTVRSAWAAAVRSGTPGNVVAELSLWREWWHPAPAWKFNVDGHQEHLRIVDAQTCAVEQRAAHSKPATATPPAPKPSHPPPPSTLPFGKPKCDCGKLDFACRRKCDGW